MEKPDNIKLKELEKTYEDKTKDIEAVSNQITETTDAETKNKLERKLNRLYEELEKSDQEIERLKSSTSSTNPYKDITEKSISPNLAFLCDRTEQKYQIEEEYKKFKKQNSYRSLVFIIHGDDKQSHDSFLIRMKEHILPNSGHISYKFRQHFLEWPSKFDNLRNRLLKNLYENIYKKGAVSEDKIKEYFVKLSGEEIIFCTPLTTKNWQEQGFDILDNLLDFWQYLYNENIIEKQLIICIIIKYKNDDKKNHILEWIKSILNFKNNHRTNKKIRNHLDLLKAKKFNNFLIVPVEELASVAKEDVDNWKYHEIIDTINQTKINILNNKINQIFHDWEKQNSSESIPMMELEKDLLNLLEELT